MGGFHPHRHELIQGDDHGRLPGFDHGVFTGNI
jgi:hypothetical protein